VVVVAAEFNFVVVSVVVETVGFEAVVVVVSNRSQGQRSSPLGKIIGQLIFLKN
jgi:hypothetical protein